MPFEEDVEQPIEAGPLVVKQVDKGVVGKVQKPSRHPQNPGGCGVQPGRKKGDHPSALVGPEDVVEVEVVVVDEWSDHTFHPASDGCHHSRQKGLFCQNQNHSGGKIVVQETT